MESEKIQNMVFLGVGFLIVFLVVVNLNNGLFEKNSFAGQAIKKPVKDYASVSSVSGGFGCQWNGYDCVGTCYNGKTCFSHNGVCECASGDWDNILPCGSGEAEYNCGKGSCFNGGSCQFSYGKCACV